MKFKVDGTLDALIIELTAAGGGVSALGHAWFCNICGCRCWMWFLCPPESRCSHVPTRMNYFPCEVTSLTHTPRAKRVKIVCEWASGQWMNIKRASHIFTHILPAMPLNRIIAVDIYFPRLIRMTCHLQAARMTCQNHVLLENAFRAAFDETRRTSHDAWNGIPWQNNNSAMPRLSSRNYSNVDSETRRNVRQLRLVPFIGDVNQRRRLFAVTFSAHNATRLTDFSPFDSFCFENQSMPSKCENERERECGSKEKIHYALPACGHQPKKNSCRLGE